MMFDRLSGTGSSRPRLAGRGSSTEGGTPLPFLMRLLPFNPSVRLEFSLKSVCWLHLGSQEQKYYLTSTLQYSGNVKRKRQEVSSQQLCELWRFLSRFMDDTSQFPLTLKSARTGGSTMKRKTQREKRKTRRD